MAPATRPAPLMPALKVRRDQLLLRQIATCGGAWTDGQTIYEGPALDRLRRETVNRLIRN